MRPVIILLPAALAAASLLACVPVEPQVTARQDYKTFCVNCHGEDGRGDGILAASLSPPPADLTQIAARNGGTFPTTQVMSVIDGYTRGQHANAVRTEMMPEFGTLLEGRSVLYDDGLGGPPVPVPERLLQLAQYLERMQD
ncbi:cytochrome c [Frigidibacter sp. ROC022]|uniref:cytochrome c n=1 Tax=Frigidibacter sp. ROC022 TaxID=2971796 RepID=UPI00215AADDA|nr:cytochrome c [Frigidibacter sp. ROC022]MCR8722988.1 cytochrome c [Frigidibacter sp. ROC022]